MEINGLHELAKGLISSDVKWEEIHKVDDESAVRRREAIDVFVTEAPRRLDELRRALEGVEDDGLQVRARRDRTQNVHDMTPVYIFFNHNRLVCNR